MRSLENKCSENSDQLSVEEKSNFLEKFENLNKSLCLASTDDQLALIYIDRANLCYELKSYKNCILNIQYAREYDLHNTHSLDALYENCQNALKSRENERDENFFSITSKINPKIPFIADCLKLTESWKFGRGVITNRAIKTGEILVIEKPFFKILDKNVRHKRCANCIKSNIMTLIPCDFKKCTSSMYCDKKCKEEAWQTYHKEECKTLENHLENNEYDLMIKKMLFESLSLFDGNVTKMKNFLSNTKNETVYDFDFSQKNEKENKKKLLKSIFALKRAKNSEEDIEMADWMVNNDQVIKSLGNSHKPFIKSFILQMMGISDRNSYIFYDLKSLSKTADEEIGSGIFAYASLFNHSCSPNLYRFFIDDQQVYIAKKPILENQQLFVGYIPNFTLFSRDERQAILSQDFFFKCSCEACCHNYPLMKDLKKCDVNFPDTPLTSCESIFEAKTIYQQNCEYIEKNFHKFPFPNYEICRAMHNSFYLIQFIANKNNF